MSGIFLWVRNQRRKKKRESREAEGETGRNMAGRCTDERQVATISNLDCCWWTSRKEQRERCRRRETRKKEPCYQTSQ